MIARAHRSCTFHPAATPDADALRRTRLAEGETLRAEIDEPVDEPEHYLTLSFAVVALAEEHDPSSCECNNDVYGQGPCADCRRVFRAYRVAKEEAALARFLGPMPINYAPRWRLFLGVPDDC